MVDLNSISNDFTSKQYEILLNLYKSSFSNFYSLSKLQEEIVKSIAVGLQTSRVSVWEFQKESLVCLKLYDFKSDSFLLQKPFEKCEIPNYFKSLQNGKPIVVTIADESEITKDLELFYLNPFSIKSIFNFPIIENDNLIGFLCCEQVGEIRSWNENDFDFVQSVVEILTLFTEEYKRKLVEQTLLENQDRFKFISENISDGIYIIENNKLIFASKTYLDMLGISAEEKYESHNKDMFQLIHPEDVQRVKDTIYESAKNKSSSVKYIFRCLKKEGEYMWREDIMNIHYDNMGHAFRAVTIARDITREKNIELENTLKKDTIELQNKLLLELYSGNTTSSFDEKIKEINRTAVKGLKLYSASYWGLKKEFLVCKHLCNTNEEEYVDYHKLELVKIPKYLEAIKSQTALIVDDVYAEDFLSELKEEYFRPSGITNMLDVPIRVNGKFYGVLCCEHKNKHREWSENDVSFARALADYLSLKIEEEKRRKAELKLNENQQKLNFISENTSDGIVVFDEGIISYVSPAFEKLSGYSQSELLNKSFKDAFNFLHPDDFIRVSNSVFKSLETKAQKFSYEYRFLCANGQYSWREDSVSVIFKPDSDEYSKHVIISRDIQERKEAEFKLQENQQQLRLIFENSTDGFVVIEDNFLKFISPSYRDFLGFTSEEAENFKTRNIFELVHQEDGAKIIEKVIEMVGEKRDTFICEYRIKGKDGVYHWREDLVNILYDPTSIYPKYIINSRDINERKKIENQLRESEKQLRLITENTSDGVGVIEDGRLTYISPSFARLLGYKDDFYKDITIRNIFENMHPDDLVKVKTQIYAALAEKETEIKYEHRFKGADGTYHWREDSANVIYDDGPEYSKYIFVTRDISARKESEKEKNQLYKITEKQNEKLINFTHIVSHDIRSHTSNLSMILDLYEETNCAEEQKMYFGMLKQSTNKLSDTIHFLNETVAVQSGIKNETVTLNLKSEILNAIVGINAIVKANDVSIVIDVPDDLFVNATQSYLESIIFNLLTNAIKYKSSERLPEIKIKSNQLGDEIKLTISDNGIGIDLSKNKDKIFGMYKTFHNNPDAVGLGLFMVKNHIESMGGSIEVESVVNEGTTFNLYFI